MFDRWPTRLGHSRPSITLDVYSHQFGGDLDRASQGVVRIGRAGPAGANRIG